MAGNKLSGLPLPSALDDAASKEYMDSVGVYARAYADRVENNAEEYTIDRANY